MPVDFTLFATARRTRRDEVRTSFCFPAANHRLEKPDNCYTGVHSTERHGREEAKRIGTASPTGFAKKEIEIGRDTSSSPLQDTHGIRVAVEQIARSTIMEPLRRLPSLAPEKADRIFPPRETSPSLPNYVRGVVARGTRVASCFSSCLDAKGNTRVREIDRDIRHSELQCEFIAKSETRVKFEAISRVFQREKH